MIDEIHDNILEKKLVSDEVYIIDCALMYKPPEK